VPFAQACLKAGHEVLVAAQAQHRGNVERAGLPVATVGDPPREEWMPLLGTFGAMDLDTADATMIGPFFAGVDTSAALDRLTTVVDAYRPDLVVRETWEFASTLVAEERGLPLARVGLTLAAMEEKTIRFAAPVLDAIRAERGLAADPAGDRLRATPYLTVLPDALEDPAAPAPPVTRRFRAGAPAAPRPLPDWWPGRADPLVYVTFGSVAAGAHLPFFPAIYRAAIEALAPLPVRVLLTAGSDADPTALGALPPNVHVERWVPQDDVLGSAAAVVCHGGYGSTLGALTYGVPLVVVPLFSGDQWLNGAAVARAGAGVALDGDRATRRVFDVPAVDGLGAAVTRVLGEPGHREAAARIAAAIAALPPVDAAADTLAQLA
jgi:UDP:flavonoid glycosyltransferase YjiC (YdhE family)